MASNQQFTRLTALDQLMPRSYSPLILTFPISKMQVEATKSLLIESVKLLVTEIPFLTYTVIDSSTRKGEVELIEPSDGEVPSLLTVKDWMVAPNSNEWNKTYQELHQQHMPMSALDGEKLAPSCRLDPYFNRPSPVFVAQANIIDGGLLLCTLLHHSVMDGPAIGTVLQRWSENCRNLQSSTAGIISTLPEGSLDRTPVLQGGRKDEKIQGHPAYNIAQPESSLSVETQAAPPSPPPMTAVIFGIEKAAIARLKERINTHLKDQGRNDVWVSTNDVICAVIWQAITRARRESREDTEPVETSPTRPCRLIFAVNGRSKLSPPLPSTYLGNVNIITATANKLTSLLDGAVSAIENSALTIRQAILGVNDGVIRSLIDLVDSLEDLSSISVVFKPLTLDVAITSWIEMGVYELDWGEAIGGGKADYIRLTRVAFDGLCIVLPRKGKEDLEVLVGLKTEHMESLRRDDEFAKYASFKCE